MAESIVETEGRLKLSLYHIFHFIQPNRLHELNLTFYTLKQPLYFREYITYN